MGSSTLTGSEVLQVLGQDGKGQPAATTQQTTTLNLGQTASFAAMSTSQLNLTTSATLTAVPGLSVNLVSGGTYTFDVYLPVSASAGGGIAVNLGQGTVTAATFTADSWTYNGTTTAAQGRVTAIGTSVATVTALATAISITGSLIATGSGTFAVFAAQNTGGNASTTSVLVGGTLILNRVS